MKKWIHVAMAFVLLVQTSACVTSRALIDYQGFDSKVQLNAGAVSGTNLGPVRGNEGGEVWSNCTEKASESLRMLIAEAKDKGANAVGNLNWYATKNSTPSCKSGWGYLVIWPFILTPLFMSTEVEGIAYKVSRTANADGLIMIPSSSQEEEALIKSLVAVQN